jgi:hypothetical protein
MHGCRGWAMVAPTTTMKVTVVVWADHGVQQSKDQIGEFPRRHLTVSLDLLFYLCVEKLRQC